VLGGQGQETAVSAYGDYLARLAGPWSDIQAHLEFLHTTALAYGTLVELGVRSGNSTAALLAAKDRHAYPASDIRSTETWGGLWSVDIAQPDVPGYWHDLDHWHFLQADDTSPQAQKWLPEKFNLLFIDTSHGYEHTLAELMLYVPRVESGGIVLLHDTEWEYPAVQLAGPTGPVARALTDYCTLEDLYWANRPGSYGLGVIRL
jgi:cephalosporin hydroxylase